MRCPLGWQSKISEWEIARWKGAMFSQLSRQAREREGGEKREKKTERGGRNV